MKETLRRWQESPARKLTSSRYLPDVSTEMGPDGEEHVASFNHPPSMEDDEVLRRLDDVVDIVESSGAEMGRDNLQRLIYIRAMGAKFAAADSLFRARQLSLVAEQLGDMDIDAQDPEVKAAIIEDIGQLNALQERMHGEIEPGRLAAMIARVRRKAQATLEQKDAPEFRLDAARRLLQNLPEVDDALAEEYIYEPSPELLAAWEPRVRKKYADFIALVPGDAEHYTREQLRDVLAAAIDVMKTKWGLDNASAWKVGFGGTNVNVDSETKTVWIPKNYPDLPSSRVVELLIHEVGGHLLRNLLGEVTDDPFFATGLPGRSSDEEALYTILQRLTSSENSQFYETGSAYYIGAGLGLDKLGLGNAMHPRDIDRVLTDMAIMNPNNNEDRGKHIGRANTSRLVRGMPSIVIDGVLHQAIDTGSLKYARGKKHAVEWLEANLDDPTALDIVASGKFAYSDPEQVAYARRLYDAHIKGRFAVPSAA